MQRFTKHSQCISLRHSLEYTVQDLISLSIDSVDLLENKEHLLIMSLSIAIVTVAHPGDVSKIASELKKKAKAVKGSVYVKDQRSQGAEAVSITTDPTKVHTER